MLVKVNPTGTHEHNGFLKVRLDLYPDVGDKTHKIHWVDKPIRPYTEEELEDEELQKLVPKQKELNPCLCHFVTVDEDITPVELEALIRETFDGVTVQGLDNALSEDNLDGVTQIMRDKTGGGRPVGKGTYRGGSTERKALNARLSNVIVKVRPKEKESTRGLWISI